PATAPITTLTTALHRWWRGSIPVSPAFRRRHKLETNCNTTARPRHRLPYSQHQHQEKSMSIFDDRESDIRAYCRVYPTVFKTAVNARQTDEQGNDYIDFFAGAGVLNFGHNNPRMKAAMIEYLESNGVTHSLDMHTTAKRRFMERFVSTVLEPRNMPHKMQFMGPTGTNAVEAALKLARRATGRQEIAAFSHGFHGMTLGALACTANQYFRGAAGVPLD